MNRSYSKIRHIQEANRILEKRLMSEQVQTTVTQTGEDPPQDNVNAFSDKKLEAFNGNTVNLYSDRENKKFKRQIRIDHINSGWNKSKDKLGKIDIAYKYEKIKTDTLTHELGDNTYFLTYSCDKPDELIPFDTKLFTGPQGIALYSKYFTDMLKKNFCTVGSGGTSVPKATFASADKSQPSNLS